MEYFAEQYDIAVIGAGHAGIEAALAASRLGAKTVCFTVNLDWVGNMPCNPSIGGTSKGHLVREIDALGGEMGRAADKNSIQIRMLNLGKGPAVHSLRAQIDRREYSKYMKHTLELQENLDLRQAEIVNLEKKDDGLFYLATQLEAIYSAKAVILATGTFLGGRVYVSLGIRYLEGSEQCQNNQCLFHDYWYLVVSKYTILEESPRSHQQPFPVRHHLSRQSRWRRSSHRS